MEHKNGFNSARAANIRLKLGAVTAERPCFSHAVCRNATLVESQFFRYWGKVWCGSSWEGFTTHTLSANRSDYYCVTVHNLTSTPVFLKSLSLKLRYERQHFNQHLLSAHLKAFSQIQTWLHFETFSSLRPSFLVYLTFCPHSQISKTLSPSTINRLSCVLSLSASLSSVIGESERQ